MNPPKKPAAKLPLRGRHRFRWRQLSYEARIRRAERGDEFERTLVRWNPNGFWEWRHSYRPVRPRVRGAIARAIYKHRRAAGWGVII